MQTTLQSMSPSFKKIGFTASLLTVYISYKRKLDIHDRPALGCNHDLLLAIEDSMQM